MKTINKNLETNDLELLIQKSINSKSKIGINPDRIEKYPVLLTREEKNILNSHIKEEKFSNENPEWIADWEDSIIEYITESGLIYDEELEYGTIGFYRLLIIDWGMSVETLTDQVRAIIDGYEYDLITLNIVLGILADKLRLKRYLLERSQM